MSFEEAIKLHVTCQGQESMLSVYVVMYGLAVDSLFSERIMCHVNNTASDFFAMMSGYYYHVHNNPNWHFYGDPHHHTTSKVLNLVPILLRLRQLESLDLQSQ